MVAKSPFTWRRRRVLVTGGSGFAAYWLASKLVEMGADVYTLDTKPLPRFAVREQNYRASMTHARGDVASQAVVKRILSQKKIQTIFHLAAEAIVPRANLNPRETLHSNIEGTWNLLECAREYKRVQEIVVASSDKAYGTHDTLPYREDFALEGMHVYDCSKSCTDLIARMYAHAYALPVVVTRFGNIYGEGDLNKSRLIPDALRCLYAGTVFAIRSDGTFLRDYVYIEDVVNGYLRLAEQLHTKNLRGEAFNLASREPMSVLDTLARIEKVTEKILKKKIVNSARNEIKDQYLDAEKAARVLGWHADTSLDEGLRKTALWYKDFFANNGTLTE